MLTINQLFPEFKLKSSLKGGELSTFATGFDKQENYVHFHGEKPSKGRWMVIFSYPLDFTFVCPTELVAFNEIKDRLDEEYDATLVAFSTDSEFSHFGWRKADWRIEDLDYPLVADPSHSLSKALGVLNEQEGIAFRSTFIVDDKGVIRHVSVNDDAVGRNPAEILRILDRLQTNELCAACSLGDTVGEKLELGDDHA